MQKIFTGNGEITPYRPWSEERKQAARERVLRKHGIRIGMRVRVNHTMPYPSSHNRLATVIRAPKKRGWVDVIFDDSGTTARWHRGYFDPA